MTRRQITLALLAALALPFGAAAQTKPTLLFASLHVQSLHLQISTEVNAWLTDRNYGAYPLSLGTHVVRVTRNDGRELSKAFEFWGNRTVTVGGKEYWCVAALGEPPSSDDDLVMLGPDDCRTMVNKLLG